MLFDVYSKEDFPISAPLPIWDELQGDNSTELYVVCKLNRAVLRLSLCAAMPTVGSLCVAAV